MITPFRIPGRIQPHEFPAKAKAEGHQVGIVTNSPRNYAEAVLRQFNIPYDSLVAFHDTTNHKPDPEPLQLALSQLSAEASRSVYFGDDAIDVEAAYHAGVRSVGAGWGLANRAELAGTAPDIVIYSLDICLPLSKLPSRRFVGEFKNVEKMEWHEGSVLHAEGGVPTCALGRYFTASDPRHATSTLTQKIIEHKGSATATPFLAERLASVLRNTGCALRYSHIVGVPKKPSKPRDRNGEVLSALASLLPVPVFVADGLSCVREYGDLKHLGPFERSMAVNGAIQTGYNWKDCNVILVDDVLTTGATTNECIRVLKVAGATEVVLVVFGKDQRTFVRKICPSCGRSMRIRTNSGDGSKFWGCSGYPDLCRNTENI